MMGVSGSKKNQSNLANRNQRNTYHRYVDPIYQNTKLHFNADDGTDFGEVLITQPKKAAFHPLEVENIEDLDDVEFPYENIVFEGGGCQGKAYIGAVKLKFFRLGISLVALHRIFSSFMMSFLRGAIHYCSIPKMVVIIDLEYKKVISKREHDVQRHTVVTEAMSKFLKVLNDYNLDGNDTINRSEFEQALTKTDEFTTAHRRALFGSHLSSSSEIFSALDISGDGEIDFHEMMMIAESRGAGIESQIIGAGWTKISKASNIVDCVFRTLLMNVKRAFLEGDDNERTVMINTAYIKSTDFDITQEDTDFLIEQGRQGIRSFLRYQKKKKQQKVERINVEESNIQTM
ncbi:uncharacterized protein LOC129257719 [Lytechinus pictus]|uniref:uncharacterized protein LOC129257719 n=1 Tax=Lytechinus pictus TaxID=7653 RepID=UPI0030B9DCFD